MPGAIYILLIVFRKQGVYNYQDSSLRKHHYPRENVRIRTFVDCMVPNLCTNFVQYGL